MKLKTILNTEYHLIKLIVIPYYMAEMINDIIVYWSTVVLLL